MRFLLAALGVFALYRYLRRRRKRAGDMEAEEVPRVTYEVTEHDGGWAYKVGDVFSEAFATRREAEEAAEAAAAAHSSPGADAAFIEYQDRRGRWHSDFEPGEARPRTQVETKPNGHRA